MISLQEDMIYSLFGQKLVIQPLGDGLSPPESSAFPNRPRINSLPSEILTLIFTFLASASKRRPFSFIHYAKHLDPDSICDCDQGWVEGDFGPRGAVFPYSPSLVCTHWQEVLSSQSVFWTRIIVSRLIGTHTPPALFKKYLEWSGTRIIDVYIGNIGYQSRHARERVLIQKYTEALSPHLKRCRIIDYSVDYATSLPVLCRDIHLIPEILFSLQLKSSSTHDPLESYPFLPADDADDVYDIPLSKTNSPEMQRMPKERYYDKMVLNGWNFLVACDYYSSILLCKTLVVQNYRQSLELYGEIDQEGLPLFDIIQKLSTCGIESAIFENIGFECDGVETDPEELLPMSVTTNLTFIGVNFDMIKQCSRMYPMLHPGTFLIKSCTFPAEYDPLLFFDVVLTDIGERDLSYLLPRLIADSVTIYDCPSLTRTVLEELGRHIKPRRGTGRLPPANIDRLAIQNCTNFVFDDLKNMIMLRQGIGMPIPNISVIDASFPISDAEEQSITDLPSVEDFRWVQKYYRHDLEDR